MDDKEAIEILKRLHEKFPLEPKEREAVKTAIGILGWSTLMKGRMESMKRSRDKRQREDSGE
jgi:hypothetical protein